jgi:2-keto-3-deoxy-galactonokinase
VGAASRDHPGRPVGSEKDIEDFDAVEEGARLSQEMGLTRALFAARLLNRVQGADPRSCSDFIHGAVAQEDLAALHLALERRGSALPTVVVLRSGGPLGQAYRRLLQKEDWVAELRDPPEPLGALGAWWLYAMRQKGRTR